MKLIAAIVFAGCLLAAGSLGVVVPTADAVTSTNCSNPETAKVGQQPIYVYFEAVDNGKMNPSVGYALRHYKGRNYSLVGWARSCGWTTNLFPKSRLPRTLCITVRDGFRSLLQGGECQQWRWQGDRRIMVFRLIR